MKQWSFIFLMSISMLFVGAAYSLNSRQIMAEDTSSSAVLGATVGSSLNATAEARENNSLNTLSKLRAEDMARNSYYSHETPEGLYFFDYFSGYGIASNTASCENLLLKPSGMSKSEVFSEWQNSPSHKACLDAGHTQFGYHEAVFDKELNLSVYVYIAATL